MAIIRISVQLAWLTWLACQVGADPVQRTRMTANAKRKAEAAMWRTMRDNAGVGLAARCP